jgi:hypothetical protein
MATETTRRNLIDPQLDVRGSKTHVDTLTEANENLSLGAPKAGQSGSVGSITAKVGNIVTVDDLTGMEADSVGRFLTLSGCDTLGNNGTFLITEYVDATSVKIYNADGAFPDANSGAIGWIERGSYMLEDDLNYERTDRKLIKGTANYYSPIPTYTRPDATGTPRDANLTNLASFTTDAKPIVRDVLEHNTYLRPPVSGTGDGNLLVGGEIFTTDGFNFTAGDLNSFITISGSTDADGTYRIKTVTDGQTLVLDGLDSGTAEACNWALVSGVKGILSTRNWADATNTTGIPIADTGAYDETRYDATYVEMVDPDDGHHPSTNAGLALWGRSFGDAKDVNKTVTNEGTRFFVQLYTGINDGTGTVAALEQLAGRSGTAGALAGGNKIITGLTGMVASDVGRFISLFSCSAAGNCGIYEIETVNSATSVTVIRTGNFTADATISWAVSQEGPLWDFYNGDRYRLDLLDETAFRTTMIGGIQSDAALATAIHNLQEFTGANPGVTSPVLTNTGNYFVFSDLPNPSDTDLEEIVNVINAQIGDRNYSGTIINDGETITQSLQNLADAIAGASCTRMIERLAAAVPKNTAHAIPAGTYTLDGTNNGQYLWVFWRKQLRDPGTPANGDDYAETSTTQITPYERIEMFDHINWMVWA